jgi:hypothetical protein
MSLRTLAYRLHKSTGQAVVTLDGKDFYLGKHNADASRAEDDRLVSEWLSNGRRLPVGLHIVISRPSVCFNVKSLSQGSIRSRARLTTRATSSLTAAAA